MEPVGLAGAKWNQAQNLLLLLLLLAATIAHLVDIILSFRTLMEGRHYHSSVFRRGN